MSEEGNRRVNWERLAVRLQEAREQVNAILCEIPSSRDNQSVMAAVWDASLRLNEAQGEVAGKILSEEAANE
jgi:hypothetical protein